MKLSKRWKTGLLITAWIGVVAVMVSFAYPNSFRKANEFARYQEGLTRSMAERNARNAESAPTADEEAQPQAD